jgi:hypothetical protein
MCKREKKSSDKFSEMYGLPGGHVKKDESNAQGCIREVMEEVNLTIHNPKFIKTYDFDDNQIHLYTKEIKNIDGIKLNHEHTDYKLVSPKDLKGPEIIPTTKDMYKDCKDKPLNEQSGRMNLISTFLNILNEEELKEIRYLITEAEDIQLSDDTKKIIEDIGIKFGQGYVKWLLFRLRDKSLLEEDIYKFDDYFKIFEKGKKSTDFTYNDIFKYKSPSQFIQEVIKSHEKQIGFVGEFKQEDEKYLVSPSDINKLQKVGIIFLGLTSENYQVFKIPTNLSGNDQAFTAQKNILGRCQGREQGARLSICTMGGIQHFNHYLDVDDLYLFFNMKDPLSPYQFNYALNGFMDKNDDTLL